MPSALRAQVALVGFLAVLLIPIGTSSLRGLTHVLTCKESTDTPFTVEVLDEGAPVISSSQVIERGEGSSDQSGSSSRGELCGGLRLDMAIGSSEAERAEIALTITNDTDYGWRGSVKLQLGSTSIPVDIGEIDPGDSVTDTIDLHLDAGEHYEIDGSLLIGP